MSPSAAPIRRFLTWDRPLLPQAVSLLAGDWQGGRPLDLSHLLVVVPTNQSGRRLREALASHAFAAGQAVFAPRVLTPDRLLAAAKPAGVATLVEGLLAWADILQEVDLGACRDVLPIDPPARDFAWALGLGRTLHRLQQTLAEGGLRLADVVGKAGDFPEGNRWMQLAALERLHDARLAQRGLVSVHAAAIQAAADPASWPGIRRIVVLGTPDPLQLAVRALASLARTLPVEVVIHAPDSEADAFDRWGRPRPSEWVSRVLALPDFNRRVHLCADPEAQASHVRQTALLYREMPGALAVGVVDADILPAVETTLERGGIEAFNPEGKSRRNHPLYHLLRALSAFASSPDFSALTTLARLPDVLRYLAARQGPDFSVARWLAGLDELQARHLPPDLDAALRFADRLKDFPQLAPALATVARLRDQLHEGSFGGNVPAVLQALLADRAFPPDADGEAWADTVVEWVEIFEACATAEVRDAGRSREDWWQLALEVFGETLATAEKREGALELQGWLELPWEDAPHLVLAGLNDGIVPESISGHAFLPESLRVRLGLKSDEVRLARDSFILQTLVRSRAADGRLDVVYGKFSADGEPLRPSRLLLKCPDAELPERVRFLFRLPPLPGPPLPWRRAWKLAVPRRAAPARVSVTALRNWLKCPFRFYLRHVLRMESVDAGKSELDALDFGTLCHGALEAMARDPAMRASADEAVLGKFLTESFEGAIRHRFGDDLSLPLLVQVRSAGQRLLKAAEVQARERAKGWVLVEAERKFELPVGGLVIAGKIDRIERHEATGEVRVLDYKTSDAAIEPARAHLRNLRPGEEVPAWMRDGGRARPRVWIDLQLPIYRHVLAAEIGSGVTCGYFNLPKAVGETGIAVWDDFDDELAASAWRCLEGVVAGLQAGTFGPPRELRGRDAALDEFRPLFHGGAAESVVWEENR